MGKGRLGSETVWWEEEEGLDMRMRRTGGRITYGIRSRRIKTCCKLLLLHIATQNQVTKSAQRIKLVSVPDPTDTRQIYYLRHSATSNGGSLVCTFVGLISLKENFTPAQRSIICVLHLTYKQPFHSASSFPSLRAFISPSLLPPSILPCHRETRGCHSWQETYLLLHPPRRPATPAASCP